MRPRSGEMIPAPAAAERNSRSATENDGLTEKKITGEAYTFDDVLIVPLKSDILPTEVRTDTRLTNKIQLNIPIVSAAMDTVTESRLAIGLAQQGGLGIIHKNMPIERQA